MILPCSYLMKVSALATRHGYISAKLKKMKMREPRKIFYEGVRGFYKATMFKKFSFKDESVDDVMILQPENQSKIDVSAAFCLAMRFSVLVPEGKFDTLEAELLDYSMTPTAQLPSVSRDEGKPTKSAEVCQYWQKVGMLKNLQGRD